MRRGPADPFTLDTMAAAAPYRASRSIDRHLDGVAGLSQLTHHGAVDVGSAAVHPETRVAVISDARLDNVVELQRSLGPAAPPAGSGTSALILATYLRWGPTGFDRLIGDFAFAIWDPRTRRLLLARDPMSMRGLYYRVEADRTVFATEVTQLLALPGVPGEPDERMMAAYLSASFGKSGWTYYRGIDQVPPGHVISNDGSTIRDQRFWDVDPDNQVHYPDEGSCREHFHELFLEAARDRLAGGQAAGVLLSGGIDSGATAASIGWLREQESFGGPLRAYSFDYGSVRECDERHISQHIVDRYGLVATDIPVEDAGPLSDYPERVPHLDDPFHGYFQAALDRSFTQAMRDGVGLIFTGMRGDLIAGPIQETYDSLLEARHYLQLAGEVRRQREATGETLRRIVRNDVAPLALQHARRSSAAGWLRWALRRAEAHPRRIKRERSPVPPWVRTQFANRIDLPALLASTADESPDLDGPLRRSRYRTVFSPMIMRWSVAQERRVAGIGTEVADIWSDRRLAEWSVLAPQQVLNHPGRYDKRLVREALASVLPPAFSDAARKIVPTPFFARVLATEAVPKVDALLTDARIEAAGWVDTQHLWENYKRFVAGTAPLDDGFWWAISLEWWLRARE